MGWFLSFLTISSLFSCCPSWLFLSHFSILWIFPSQESLQELPSGAAWDGIHSLADKRPHHVTPKPDLIQVHVKTHTDFSGDRTDHSSLLKKNSASLLLHYPQAAFWNMINSTLLLKPRQSVKAWSRGSLSPERETETTVTTNAQAANPCLFLAIEPFTKIKGGDSTPLLGHIHFGLKRGQVTR